MLCEYLDVKNKKLHEVIREVAGGMATASAVVGSAF